jgi:hypothetical protein
VTSTYHQGFHSYLFPAERDGDESDTDWLQGWEDAKALAAHVRNKPRLSPVLMDDGKIDMFIVGPDGIPVARINEPTQTGEEAEALARAWLAAVPEQEPEEIEEADENGELRGGSIVIRWLDIVRLYLGKYQNRRTREANTKA